MRPKKSLGQHFLKSEKALAQIVAAADVLAADIVLEIGPGEGILTSALLAKAKKVIAIEKDRELVPHLEERFAHEIKAGKLELIEADILKFNPEVLPKQYKLVANIPYYITGAIFEQFLSAKNQPSQMVVLIQKEVAERIISQDKKESILSIAIKAYGTPKIIAKVPAGAFNPPPKVDSAILSIEHISRDFFANVSEEKFFAVMKWCFGKKRKQLHGSLSEFVGDRAQALLYIERINLNPKIRPEDLTLSDWKRLTQTI